jgi:hypothetical protein
MKALTKGEEGVTFQLLGDAASIPSPPLLRSSGEISSFRKVYLDQILADISWLDQLYSTVVHWGEPCEATRSAYQGFFHLAQLIFRAENLTPLDIIEDEDRTMLREATLLAMDRLRVALWEELCLYIAKGKWLEAVYAPLSRRTRVKTFPCPRCEGRASQSRYSPYCEFLMWVDRFECERCGTLGERFGSSEAPDALIALVEKDWIRVLVSPLESGGEGRVFVHRTTAVSPQAWPPQGGEVMFRVEDLPFRGRVTLVAAVWAPHQLAFTYRTLFVPPVEDTTGD